MNITITLQASPELINAINGISAAITGLSEKKVVEFAPAVLTAPVPEHTAVQAPVPAEAPVPVTPAHPVPAPAVPTAPAPAAPPTAAPAQAVPVAPQAAPTQAPAAVPTAVQTYTLNQLAVAATQLVDAGRREELVQLLASFGVPALTALPKELYGEFATRLRAMGAKI